MRRRHFILRNSENPGPETSDHGSRTPWWLWAGGSGLSLLSARALSSKGPQAPMTFDQGITTPQDSSKRRGFPWGKVAVGTLAGYTAVKLGPKIPEFLDGLLAAVQSAQMAENKVDVDKVTSAFGTPTLSPPSVTPTALWTPPSDSQWPRLAPHPSVILTVGMRGSGKSALGYRLLELYRDVAAPYVVGFPPGAKKLLPDWIGIADRLEDVPPQAVVLIDEAYLQLHARSSMSEAGRGIGPAVNLSRQRGQTLIFNVQEARQLDVNVISQADVIAIKELAEISREFERRELRSLTDKARAEFRIIQGDRRKWTWVYSEKADFSGLVENQLPSFWCPALSRAFAGVGAVPSSEGSGTESASMHRKGARTPREVLASKAKALHEAGRSYGQIANILGIPKSSVWDLVKGG